MLPDERIHRLANDRWVYQDLIREITNYLRFRKDERVSSLLVALLTHKNNTMSESQKNELFKHLK